MVSFYSVYLVYIPRRRMFPECGTLLRLMLMFCVDGF